MSTQPDVILVALGSNIEPEENLPRATELLAERLDVVAVSAVYEGPAVGAQGTPRFLNAVLRVETDLGPRSLKFGLLRALETRLGRRRGRDPNAPRTLDLDLILYGDRVDDELDLVLPDRALLTEAHVALPAADVAGDTVHPISGSRLGDIASSLVSDLVERPDVVLRTVA